MPSGNVNVGWAGSDEGETDAGGEGDVEAMEVDDTAHTPSVDEESGSTSTRKRRAEVGGVVGSGSGAGPSKRARAETVTAGSGRRGRGGRPRFVPGPPRKV